MHRDIYSPDELSLVEYWSAFAFGAVVVLEVAKLVVWDRFVRKYR